MVPPSSLRSLPPEGACAPFGRPGGRTMRPPLAVVLSCAIAGAAASAQTPKQPPEPKVQHIVVEDEAEAVRIEELRVRGLTQRVVVKPKNAAEY